MGGWMCGVLRDVRGGWRGMRRAPGFAATVVGVLALGIGANAAMFTVLSGTVLRRLPFRRAGELVGLQSETAKGEVMWTNLADIEMWRGRSRSLAGIAYYDGGADGLLDAGGGDTDVLRAGVSENLFGVLGVKPVLGRGFLPEEQMAGKDGVVVLSEEAWRTVFGGAADVVGRVVRVDDKPATVVGVMPAGFRFPVDAKAAEVWTPLAVGAAQRERSFFAGSYQAIGRLRPGADAAGAGREVTALQGENAKLYAGMAPDLAPSRVAVRGYRAGLIENQRPALLGLMGAVGVVWLIACANVANLMLARSTARRKEMAVRGALGASAGRLVQQTLVESLMLSLAGAGVGVGLAWVTLMGFRHALDRVLPVKLAVAPDGRVLLWLLGLSVVSALVFGVAPALLGARVPLEQTLRDSGAQAGGGRRQHRVQRALVMAEIGLSVTMLVACGLLLRTVFALRNVPLGFRTDHVFVVSPKLPGVKYKGLDTNATVYKPLLAQVKALPGVEAATMTTTMPLSKGFNVTLNLNMNRGAAGKDPGRTIQATLKAAGPDLQKVLGFQMVRGRFFSDSDTADSQQVVVVNEAFAKMYEATTGPIEQFTIGSGAKGVQAKIIGIVKDFHQVGIAEAAKPEIDVDTVQMRLGKGFYQPTMGVRVELAVRANRDARSLVPELERVMREVNPDLRAGTVRTMDEVVENAMGSQLLAAHLLEVLGGLALVVALGGLYSLMAYLLTLRTRELGVRLALGAGRGDLVRLLMGQAGWMVGGGLALGVGLSLGTMRMLQHFLFGVGARDGWTLGAVLGLMAVVAGVAAFVPARRAAGIEPMEALRAE